MFNRDEFAEEIRKISMMPNRKDEFFNHVNNSGGGIPVYLYGAGHACEFYRHYLTQNGIKIEGIIDNAPEKRGRFFHGLVIFSLEDIAEKDYDEVNILIAAPSRRREIKNLLNAKVPKAHVFSFEIEAYECFGVDADSYKNWIVSECDRIYGTYEDMADARSRQVLLDMIKVRATADLDYMDEVNEDRQYWPKGIIAFSDKERIIECGSNDGETLREMCNILGGNWNHIYCLEPDPSCREALENVIKKEDPEGSRVTYIAKGSFSKSGRLYFDQHGENSELSRLSDKGNTAIEVTAIDDLALDEVTYIKMDVEGSELETLRGAEKTIRRDKPALAVCLYHRPEDIVTIPEYIKKLNPCYRFFLRHHNCVSTESVLYAIGK